MGYFLPEANKLGEVQHESALAMFAVPANGCCETDLGADVEAGAASCHEALLQLNSSHSSSRYAGWLPLR